MLVKQLWQVCESSQGEDEKYIASTRIVEMTTRGEERTVLHEQTDGA